MSTQVESAFMHFDAYIRPSSEQLATAQEAEERISRLVLEITDIVACLPVGSMVRGTAIRRYSDLDLLAVFSEREDKISKPSPSELLAIIAWHLRLGVADIKVHVGTMAISLDYPYLPVDVIPALLGDDSGRDEGSYRIPATDGRQWQSYSHRSQDLLLESRESELGPHVKSLIRMIKWWNYRNSNTLTSFGIEQLVCSAFDRSIPAYPEAIEHIFVAATQWSVQRRWFASGDHESMDALNAAVAVSRAALQADALNTPSGIRRAIACWRGLFGDEFSDIFE